MKTNFSLLLIRWLLKFIYSKSDYGVTTTLSGKKGPIIACIPAYNEEKAIAKIVLLCKKHVDEVLVCDDGSSDMTGEIAAAVGAYVIYHEGHLGYDTSIKSLFEGAHQLKAEIIVTYDFANQSDPVEIPKLIERLMKGDADIVIGSNLLKEEQINSTKKTSPANTRVIDYKSGLMAFSERVIESMTNALGFGQSIETILKSANMLNITIVEVEISPGKKQIVQMPKTSDKYRDLFIRKPFMFFSLPGLLAIFTALGFSALAVQQFLLTNYLSTNMILLASAFAITSLILLTTSLTLWMIPKRIKEIN
jgi:hypothetical protein